MKKYLLVFLIQVFLLKADYIGSLEITSEECSSLLKNDIVYFIKVDVTNKTINKRVKIKSIISIHGGFLEYINPKIELARLDKYKQVIVYSKIDNHSKQFVQNLINIGFKNIHYLEDGEENFNNILRKFRGIKSYSIFTKF